MFKELFYWDTYFMNVGLLRIDMQKQAQNNTDDLLFLANKLGFVPNASRYSMTNRSQPPFLALMVRDIFANTGDRAWLQGAYSILAKEYDFWMTRRISPVGLNRWHNSATEQQLLGFYNYLANNRFKGLTYTNNADKIAFSSHSLSEAETGWDFTPRFDRRCEDFCAVDQNSLLYLYETLLAQFSKTLGNGAEAGWLAKAEQRKKLMQKYLWNEKIGCFTDYDFVNKKKGDLVSCATLYPLVAGLATKEQAEKIVRKMRAVLEGEHGLAACEQRPEKFVYQWDHPNGWPPLQCIAIQALDRYGFKKDACRIAEKYVRTVIRNFEKTGDLWEKYNVVTGTIEVKDEYQMPRMVGWTAGTFVFAAEYAQANRR